MTEQNQAVLIYTTHPSLAEAERIGKAGLKAVRRVFEEWHLFRGGGIPRASLDLLKARQFTAAETYLKEGLAIREKAQPDAWNTFNAQSMLGGALLGQQKYADAEPLLLAGYEGLKQREKTIPPQGKARIPEAIERLVQLYEAMDNKEEAGKWRKELEGAKAAAQP